MIFITRPTTSLPSLCKRLLLLHLSRQRGCCAPFCELIFGKSEIDYEKIGPVGITAVAPVSSRYLDPFDKNEKMRNGPIASGNFGQFV